MKVIMFGQNCIPSQNLATYTCSVLGIKTTLFTIITTERKNGVDLSMFAYVHFTI